MRRSDLLSLREFARRSGIPRTTCARYRDDGALGPVEPDGSIPASAIRTAREQYAARPVREAPPRPSTTPEPGGWLYAEERAIEELSHAYGAEVVDEDAALAFNRARLVNIRDLARATAIRAGVAVAVDNDPRFRPIAAAAEAAVTAIDHAIDLNLTTPRKDA